MLYKKYLLFSNPQTCPPCRQLKSDLDTIFPTWEDHISYIDINSMTPTDFDIVEKLNVRRLPSFTNQDEIIHKGYSLDILKNIVELCIQESKP